MVFSSITFVFYFLPAVVLIYFLSPVRFRNYVLLGSSILFYSWGAPKFIVILLASTIIDFYVVQHMATRNSESSRKSWLSLSIFLNLGLLAYFKYSNFFVENLQDIFSKLGWSSFGWIEVVLPIGISFYTFQTLTYSIDVYRKTHAPLKKVSDYVLYITMFPQLIAGPIVRFHEIADQLTQRTAGITSLIEGFIRFSFGLAKKVLIANVLARQADFIFQQPFETLGFMEAWLGILCYTFQIYFDFAGYSDMAIGLGKMFGFRFPENFNAPYTSVSITEFWRKWHITLGRFMKNYLYIPLGGNEKGVSRTYRNLFIVFFLSGLWHGSNWNFLLWGAFHGVFLVLERLTRQSKKQDWKFIRIPFTFIIVVLGWVLFRTESIGDALSFYSALFSFDSAIPLGIYDLKLVSILILAFLFSFLPTLGFGNMLMNYFYGGVEGQNRAAIMFSLSVLLFLFSVASLTSSDFNPFIYFRF